MHMRAGEQAGVGESSEGEDEVFGKRGVSLH